MTLHGKLVAFGAAMALAACGGSSSGGRISYTGSTSLATVSDGNALSLAGKGAEASSPSAGGIPYAPAFRASTKRSVQLGYRVADTAMRRLATAASGLTITDTQPCQVSGSETMSASIANTNVGFTSGDWMQVTYASCDEGTGVTLDGTARIDITRTQGGVLPLAIDPNTDPVGTYELKLTALDVTTKYNDTGDWDGMNGVMIVTIVWNGSTETVTVHGPSLASQTGNGSAITGSAMVGAIPGTSGYSFADAEDLVVDAYGYYQSVSSAASESVRMCSLDLNPPAGACIDVSVNPALVKNATETYPHQGELRVTGMGGAYVDLLVLNNQYVTITYDVDGAGSTPAVTITPVAWTCISYQYGCP
jgi:hypothetical protein